MAIRFRHGKIFAIAALLAAGMALSALLAYRIALRQSLGRMAGDSAQQLQLQSLALQRLIDRYRVLPGTLADPSHQRSAAQFPQEHHPGGYCR